MDFSHLAQLLAIDDLTAKIDAVENRLIASLGLDDVELGSPSIRMALSGGKRLRPVLVIASANVFGDFDERVIAGCAAVELVQVGSLVHDDIFDRAATRRGVATINAVEGVNPAILAGDFILARAGVEAAAVSGQAARVLAQTVIELCVGQHQETIQLGDQTRTVAEHFASIEAKTASLFDVSAQIGAIAAGASDDEVAALGRFARAFGMSFQIVDDVLDLVADPLRLGKPIGSDLRAGVYTLPVLRALSNDRSSELSELLSQPIDAAAAARAGQLVSASDGVQYALDVAQSFEEAAVRALDGLGDHPTVEGMRRLPEHYRVWALSTLGDGLEVGPVAVS